MVGAMMSLTLVGCGFANQEPASGARTPVAESIEVQGGEVVLRIMPGEPTEGTNPEYVLENPMVRDLSPSGLRAMATSFLDGNYHPLTVLSLAVDYRFGGLDPSGYHRTNVAVHVLATLAVFWLALLLTGSRELSAFVAL